MSLIYYCLIGTTLWAPFEAPGWDNPDPGWIVSTGLPPNTRENRFGDWLCQDGTPGTWLWVQYPAPVRVLDGVLTSQEDDSEITIDMLPGDVGGRLAALESQPEPTWSTLSGKPAFATVATSGSYSDLSDKPTMPDAQVQPDWNAVTGMGVIQNKPSLAAVATAGTYSSLTGIPSTFAPAAHNQSWSTITSTPTTLSGYGITDGVTSSSLSGALTGYATTSALTSGLAGKLDKPGGTTAQYVRGDGSLATLPTTVAPSQSAVTRSLNTAFQVSATRNADVRYSVQCTITANIAGGQNCDIVLEIASDSAFTSNVQTIGIAGTGQTYTLAVAIQGVQPQTSQVVGWVPAGYYVRIRTVQNTGAPTFSYRAGQEILY